MLLKIFSRGKGSGNAPINYLLGNDYMSEGILRAGARIVSGNPVVTQAMINSSNFARRYTAGVLSFEEAPDAISEADKQAIIQDFEKAMFAGMAHDRYNILNRPGIVGDPKLWDNTLMKTKQYSTEIKTRAVELLIESQKDYPSLWAAIQAIAPKFGCTPETLRSWHQKHLAKQNPITVTTESQAARIAELEREIKELKQANEIIRKAAAFFAQAELDRKPK